MPNAANYTVLSDAPATLRIGGDVDHEYAPFRLPGLVNDLSAILTLQIHQVSSDKLKWVFEINGQPITSPLTKGTFFAATQEVIGSGILKDDNNSAKVTLLSGDGELNISDVVVHYKRSV